MEIKRAIGRALREARREAGLTQPQVAEHADLDRTYPSMIECGQSHPSVGVFLRYCSAVSAAPDAVIRRIVALQHG